MSELPPVGQKPAQAPVSTEPVVPAATVDPGTPATIQTPDPVDSMAGSRPAPQDGQIQQPLDGAFQKKAAAPRPNLDLRGLETAPKLISQATLSLLTTTGLNAEFRATVGQWVGTFE